MEIFPSCSHVSIIEWLHHLDFNKTTEEKAKWELYKNAACCFEQIQETGPKKSTTERPLTSHLTNMLVTVEELRTNL